MHYINYLINPQFILEGITSYINLLYEVIRVSFGAKVSSKSTFPPFVFFIINAVISILLFTDLHILKDAILNTMVYNFNFIYLLGYFSVFGGFIFFYIFFNILLKFRKKYINPHKFMLAYCYASGIYLLIFLYINILQFLFAGLIFIISDFYPLLPIKAIEYVNIYFIIFFLASFFIVYLGVPFFYWVRIFSYYYKLDDYSKINIKRYAWSVIILIIALNSVIDITGVFDIYDTPADTNTYTSPYSSGHIDKYGATFTNYPAYISNIALDPSGKRIIHRIDGHRNYLFHLLYLDLLSKAEKQIYSEYIKGNYASSDSLLLNKLIASYDAIPFNIRYDAELKVLAVMTLNNDGYRRIIIENPSDDNKINYLENQCEEIIDQHILPEAPPSYREDLKKEVDEAKRLKQILMLHNDDRKKTIDDVLESDRRACKIDALFFKKNLQDLELRILPL